MTTPASPRPDFAAMLDVYLDGALSGPDLADFEAELARNPDLRRHVELHRRIEQSLKGSFQPESVALPAPALHTSPAPTIAPWRTSPLYRFGMLSAAAALLLAAGVFTYTQLTSSPSFTLKTIRPDALYAKVVDAGFQPQWTCNNDAEFAESVRYRLGQPLLVAQDTPGLQVLGWAYPDQYKSTPLSDRTMILLSTVDGERNVVYVDRASADKPLEVKSGKLNLFRRQIGDLVLYEVTPKDRAVVIEAMYKPEVLPEPAPKAPDPG